MAIDGRGERFFLNFPLSHLPKIGLKRLYRTTISIVPKIIRPRIPEIIAKTPFIGFNPGLGISFRIIMKTPDTTHNAKVIANIISGT